jgi:hypothetical protein
MSVRFSVKYFFKGINKNKGDAHQYIIVSFTKIYSVVHYVMMSLNTKPYRVSIYDDNV